MSNEKLDSNEQVIKHWKERAHRILDVLFVTSDHQMSDAHQATQEELETAILIVWRHNGNRKKLEKQLKNSPLEDLLNQPIPDTPPSWLSES